jgi:lipoprotein signal peptidase
MDTSSFSSLDRSRISGAAWALALALFFLAAGGAAYMLGRTADWFVILYSIVLVIFAFYILFALKVADQWEKMIVLRLGKVPGIEGSRSFLDLSDH